MSHRIISYNGGPVWMLRWMQRTTGCNDAGNSRYATFIFYYFASKSSGYESNATGSVRFMFLLFSEAWDVACIKRHCKCKNQRVVCQVSAYSDGLFSYYTATTWWRKMQVSSPQDEHGESKWLSRVIYLNFSRNIILGTNIEKGMNIHPRFPAGPLLILSIEVYDSCWYCLAWKISTHVVLFAKDGSLSSISW